MNQKTKMIDGRAIAARITDELKSETVQFFQKTKVKPKLSVVILGENPASMFYVRMIEKTCKKVDFEFAKHALSDTAPEEELLSLIEQLNDDEQVHGIIIQTPLPRHINQETVQKAVHPDKDVDCFNPINMGKLAMGSPSFLPCTPHAVFEILKREQIAVNGKHVVIVGRSNIVGKPLGLILLLKNPHANATVTVCHSKTLNISFYTQQADIIVAAAGKAGLIGAEMIKNHPVVIDVGTNEVEGKLVGDVNFDVVAPLSSKITPVPGGVGPVTNMMLMKNTLLAAKKQLQR